MPQLKNNPTKKYREEWLMEGLYLLSKNLFSPKKYKVSKKIQVSCGFPSSRALSTGRRAIGECWYPQDSDTHQLFISPTISDPVLVLATLTHEVVHTIVGSKAAHGPDFKYVALRVGLEGKMTATTAGEELTKLLSSFSQKLGRYPHIPIDKKSRPKIKRGPTVVRGECPNCSYRVSISTRWIEEAGFPICPRCNISLAPKLEVVGSNFLIDVKWTP